MADAAYFAPFVVLPTVIDGPGQYVTRCGEIVEISQASNRHDFGCAGAYSNSVGERWHKSGRLFASRETVNDVVARHSSAPRLAPGMATRLRLGR